MTDRERLRMILGAMHRGEVDVAPKCPPWTEEQYCEHCPYCPECPHEHEVLDCWTPCWAAYLTMVGLPENLLREREAAQ